MPMIAAAGIPTPIPIFVPVLKSVLEPEDGWLAMDSVAVLGLDVEAEDEDPVCVPVENTILVEDVLDVDVAVDFAAVMLK